MSEPLSRVERWYAVAEEVRGAPPNEGAARIIHQRFRVEFPQPGQRSVAELYQNVESATSLIEFNTRLANHAGIVALRCQLRFGETVPYVAQATFWGALAGAVLRRIGGNGLPLCLVGSLLGMILLTLGAVTLAIQSATFEFWWARHPISVDPVEPVPPLPFRNGAIREFWSGIPEMIALPIAGILLLTTLPTGGWAMAWFTVLVATAVACVVGPTMLLRRRAIELAELATNALESSRWLLAEAEAGLLDYRCPPGLCAICVEEFGPYFT